MCLPDPLKQKYYVLYSFYESCRGVELSAIKSVDVGYQLLSQYIYSSNWSAHVSFNPTPPPWVCTLLTFGGPCVKRLGWGILYEHLPPTISSPQCITHLISYKFDSVKIKNNVLYLCIGLHVLFLEVVYV